MCAACHTGTAYTLRLDVVRVTGEIRGVGVNRVEPSNVCGQAVEEVAAGRHAFALAKGGRMRAVFAL